MRDTEKTEKKVCGSFFSSFFYSSILYLHRPIIRFLTFSLFFRIQRLLCICPLVEVNDFLILHLGSFFLQSTVTMRILCLHGLGTNSKILESQLTTLRSRLPSDWEFEFLDGEVEAQPAPGKRRLIA